MGQRSTKDESERKNEGRGKKGKEEMSQCRRLIKQRGNFSALSLFPIVPDRGEKEDRVQENKIRNTGSR